MNLVQHDRSTTSELDLRIANVVQLNNKETAEAFSYLIKYGLLQLTFVMFGEFVQHFLCKLNSLYF